MLTNTDQFIEAALHFKEFGVYTRHPRNPHGKSPYMLFWKEQRRRCLEGYHIGSDFITGYHYFYLNFSPIWRLKYDEKTIGSDSNIQGERIYSLPLFWDGDYNFFHYVDDAEKAGKHAVAVKCRGRGFSFKASSMGCRNYFLVPGSKSFYIAAGSQYLVEDGVLTKAWDTMSFIDSNTAWSKMRQMKDTVMHRRASYKVTEGGVVKERGYKSEIIGITVDKDSDVIRGKRGKLMIIEEGGNLKDICKLVRVAKAGMEQGKVTFGLILAFGTGGEEYEDLEGLEELFYYPDSYNIHAVQNIWDKNANRDSKCGFFFPVHMNYEGFYDKDGNSDFIGARKDEDRARELIRKTAKSNKTLLQHIAENCLEPREAFLKQTATIFPVSELRERLSELEVNHDKYRNAWWIGRMYTGKDGRPAWAMDNSLSPIESYPIRDDEREGCVVIYEMPYRVDGKVPSGLYISGADPYGQDQSQTDSVGSLFIMNLLTDRIVAEYTGRPATTHDYYDGAVKLLDYYNALCNYENDIKGLYDYCYNHGYLHLLSETPEILLERDIISADVSSARKYGTPGTTAVDNWGLQLIKQYLLTPNPVDKETLNVYKIQSPGLIRELLHWNPKGNFDRIKALSYLLILKQQFFKRMADMGTKKYSVSRDKFWDRPFSKKSVSLHV